MLYQKILRTIFVARRWTSSILSGHNDDPLQFGWIIEDNGYNFLWFEGDSRPTVGAVCLTEDIDAEEDDQDEELMYSDEDADEDDASDDEAED